LKEIGWLPASWQEAPRYVAFTVGFLLSEAPAAGEMFVLGSLVLISWLCKPLISSHLRVSPLTLPLPLSLPTLRWEALQAGQLPINPVVAFYYTGRPQN